MLKYAIPVLAICIALSPGPGRADEASARDLTQDEQATIAGGLQFLAGTLGLGAPKIQWLPLHVPGENTGKTAYCGILNSFYLFEADVTIDGGSITEVGKIRIAIQGDDAQRLEVERLCAAAGYGKELGAQFSDPVATPPEDPQ